MVQTHPVGIAGAGRSHIGRGKRQARVGSLFQAIASLQHQRDVTVPGFVPTR